MNSAKMGCTQSGIQRRGRHTGSSSSRTPVAPATPVFSGDGEEALLKTSDGTSTTTSTRGCGVLSNSKHHSDGNSLKVKPLERPVNHGSVNECSVPLFSSTERSHDDGWKGTVALKYGSMYLAIPTVKVLFVFSKEDAQYNALKWAAEKMHFECQITTSSETAVENYLNSQPHLVFIDARGKTSIDASTLCRKLRGLRGSQFSCIVAVVKKG